MNKLLERDESPKHRTQSSQKRALQLALQNCEAKPTKKHTQSHALEQQKVVQLHDACQDEMLCNSRM
jgi:hypothetical protein